MLIIKLKMVIMFQVRNPISFKHIAVFILGPTPNHICLKYECGWLRSVNELGMSTLHAHSAMQKCVIP